MGATTINLHVINFVEQKEIVPDILVDTGAGFTALPQEVFKRLDIAPSPEKKRFKTFDGTVIERDIGLAIVEYKGRRTADNIIFAQLNDRYIIGFITLELMGLKVDPATGEIELGPVPWD